MSTLMSARKMRNTWWVDFRFGGERYRKRSPENSRAGALAYEAVLRGRLTRGEPLQEPARNETPPTFETFAWRWYDTYVRANNRLSEQINITSDVRDALLALDRTRPYVFGRYGYRPLDQKTAEHALREACRGAGLRHIGWHTLRHTFASHLAMKGVSMKAIQELLGHSHMTMTMRYAHLAPSTLRDAVSVLEPVRVAGQPIVGQRAVNALALIGIQKQKHPELLGVPANPQT
jgi:integrase